MNRPGNFHVALVLGLLLSAGCSTGPVAAADDERSADEVSEISGTGTVRYVSLEGGFFAIRGDDNKTYDPINLAPEYRKDGLRVRFSAKLRTHLGSFRMVGNIIELTAISRL